MRAYSGFARWRCGTSPFTAHGNAPTWRSHASSQRSPTDVADVAAATALALEAAPGVYNVGGGEEATMREALALLESIAKRSLHVTYGPPQTGDMHRTKTETSRIERELGWRADTPLRDGLAKHWQWSERARLTSR